MLRTIGTVHGEGSLSSDLTMKPLVDVVVAFQCKELRCGGPMLGSKSPDCIHSNFPDRHLWHSRLQGVFLFFLGRLGA